MSNSATRCMDKAAAKSLLCSNSQTCTLSQNGWGACCASKNVYSLSHKSTAPQVAGRAAAMRAQEISGVRRAAARHNRASQRSAHSTPIFRLLLKVAVNGAHQCHLLNLGRRFGSNNPKLALPGVTAVWPRENKMHVGKDRWSFAFVHISKNCSAAYSAAPLA